MPNKNPNIQDKMLNELRKKGIVATVFTTNGVQIKGKINGFDKFSVLIVNDKNQQLLLYKHAISTIVPFQPVNLKFTEE
jgi:host factor-I protein